MADEDETIENDDSDSSGSTPPPHQNIKQLDIQDEMRSSYLTYAMSVIVSRALPDVRDGLKPSQRRILVAMNDLNLGPNTHRMKCAKISGDTSGNYHPHGDGSIYPTLVRLAQPWAMREVLIDKQGNFGSLAGLPPAAMRYTEARLSAVASEMLHDIDRDTVDFAPTYDQRNMEPVVLPARFPNLLVNGSSGIAVGMATSIPPHNLNEVCDAVVILIDNPEATIDDIMEVMPAPDFPTGGIICGRMGVRQGYKTGRSTISLRAKTHFETHKKTECIVVTEIPYMENRDRIREKLEQLVKDNRIEGISRVTDLTDRTLPPWQVNIQIDLKRDADPEVVLNLLFKFSPLQTTISMILLALVGNRPQVMSVIDMLKEFLRHRVTVIRRRTEFMLAEARKRKHTVEGLLIAQIDIDQIIATIRASASRSEAREKLREIDMPAELVARALGKEGFAAFQSEYGTSDMYHLSAKQSDAIISMQLGSLANLEREELNGEHIKLLEEIGGYLDLLSNEDNIRAVIRDDMLQLQSKHGDKRRTEISDEELGDVNKDDLITEEPMVVTISQRGYVKRTALNVYQAQNRGGKGIKGAKTDTEDPIEHLFVSSTHAYLLFFTDRGKVYWRKVYDLPEQGRTAKGRAIVNLLSLQDGSESVSSCFPVREFTDDHFLIIATRNGIVKKTALSAYGRPQKGGIIALKLDDDDDLIDVRVVSGDDDIILATSTGMSIRFSHDDARPIGRTSRGVKGIKVSKEDAVVGMVIADPELSLLTICEHGYGKRTRIGLGRLPDGDETNDEDSNVEKTDSEEVSTDEAAPTASTSSSQRYRRQNRGGKGVRDIRTTERNGKVVGILAVSEEDEVLMVTAKGKIQRVRAMDISQIGRNTQGVRIIRLDDGDTVVSIARISSGDMDDSLLDDNTVETSGEQTPPPTGDSSTDETPADESKPENDEESGE